MPPKSYLYYKAKFRKAESYYGHFSSVLTYIGKDWKKEGKEFHGTSVSGEMTWTCLYVTSLWVQHGERNRYKGPGRCRAVAGDLGPAGTASQWVFRFLFLCLFVCLIYTRLGAKEISSLETPMGADFKKPQLNLWSWVRMREKEQKRGRLGRQKPRRQ